MNGKWYAVFQWSTPSNHLDTHRVPIISWEARCVDGNDSMVGYVVKDRDGNDLPFPVPAPNVLGFIRYEKGEI